MTLNKSGYLGYKNETTFGERAQSPPTANDSYYKEGIYYEAVPFPTVVANTVRRDYYNDFDAKSLDYGRYAIDRKVTYNMVNGTALYYALGKITTSGSGPYVHTITGITPGEDLPSRTFHYEIIDGTEERVVDFKGTRTNSLTITAGIVDKQQLGTICSVEEISTEFSDNSASDNPAVKLTNKPSLPTNSGSEPYFLQDNAVLTIDGNSILAELQTISITIKNNLVRGYSLRSGTDDYGKTVNRWADTINVVKRELQLVLTILSGNTNSEDLWDFFANMSKDKQIVFQLARSSTDYVKFTFDASHCVVKEVTSLLPRLGMEDDAVSYAIIPASVTVEVKDDMTEAQFTV